MRIKLVLICLLCSVLTGCTIGSPVGTWTITYDGSIKTDELVFTLDKGDSYSISADTIKSNLSTLLASVDLPNGTTQDDFESFVYSNLESLNIDLDNLITEEDIKVAEEAILEILKNQGVDTSDLNIDLDKVSDEE